MASKPVEFHPEAFAEVELATLWYGERNQSVSFRFLTEIQSATRLIGERPKLWAPFAIHLRRYVLRRFPYSLIYKEQTDVIQVIAVAHAHRRPGYWLTRL